MRANHLTTWPFFDLYIAGRNAMITDIVVRTILLAWRFFHGGWQRIEV